MTDELNRNTKHLWQDYAFLTKEIGKFVEKGDDDLVNDLLDQRERLQAIIEEKNDKDYVRSPEGKTLIEEILTENKKATVRLQQRYNHLKQQHKLSETYEGNPSSVYRSLDTQM